MGKSEPRSTVEDIPTDQGEGPLQRGGGKGSERRVSIDPDAPQPELINIEDEIRKNTLSELLGDAPGTRDTRQRTQSPGGGFKTAGAAAVV